MEVGRSPEMHVAPVKAWQEEMTRREQIAEELREEYREILQPVLDHTERFLKPWQLGDLEGTDEYYEDVFYATAQVMPQIVPDSYQEGIKPAELNAFFTEVAGVPSEETSKAALTYLLHNGTLRADGNWWITRAPEQ